MFNKILIANRGEIACRIIDSLHAGGYDTVAVHSEADAEGLFVSLADESIALGGNTSAESYLDIDKVIAAAKASGAGAIHPGYGFLSENAEFSSRCEAEGITFIGPRPHAIQVMGNKAAAKQLMLENGVPCIPGYEGSAQDEPTLIKEAAKIGYPLMVKAAAGGGGRGIRLVVEEGELVTAIRAARVEAKSAFGSDELILEKAVTDARHIEVQIAADEHGHVLHLFERDCSAQRRHQKVIEEAPSPFMTDALRETMGTTAVNAARAVDYVGVGTVEFLVDADRNFYFLEMNTRLQVEHPVTELISGVDIVDWQIRIASGAPLPASQEDLEIDGHAIEVRIYAEDAARGFMPQTGTLRRFEAAEGEGVRIDHGVYSGSVVSSYYDSMLAKVITWGRDREEARRRLIRALCQTTVLGLTTNKSFLIGLLSQQAFIDGGATTQFISEELLAELAGVDLSDGLALAAVVLNLSDDPLHGFTSTAPVGRTEMIRCNDDLIKVELLPIKSGFQVSLGEISRTMTDVSWDDETVVYTLDGVTRAAEYSIHGDDVSLDLGRTTLNATRVTYAPVVAEGAAGSGIIKATTEGLVVDILVREGDRVRKGDTVIVIEAMKMEHRHLAERDGEVASVRVAKEQQVKNRQVLVELAEMENELESD